MCTYHACTIILPNIEVSKVLPIEVLDCSRTFCLYKNSQAVKKGAVPKNPGCENMQNQGGSKEMTVMVG